MVKCLQGPVLLAPLGDGGFLRAVFEQLVLGETDVKAGVVHWIGGRRVRVRNEAGLRGQEIPLAPVLLGTLAAAGGRQKRPAVPEQVVVVPQRRQQRLGLGTDARVLAGRAGAALDVAERVEVGGGQGARGDVREGEAAAAAGGRVAAADLPRRVQSCDV